MLRIDCSKPLHQGPYGFEDVIGAAGGMIAIVSVVVIPLFWSIPLALMTGELSCMIPESGGHILWVFHAFGPFWSMFNCVLSFVCGILDNALYPALLMDYVSHALDGVTYVPSAVQLVVKCGMVIAATAINLFGATAVGK